MPVGVVTSTSLKSSPAVLPASREARFFVAGVTERGPVGEAVRCRSLADFEAVFGGAVSYSNLHEHMRVFWAEGGYEAYVSRIVGPDPVNALISLDSGKLVVTAKNPGAFANGWTAAYTSASKTLTVVTDTATETYAGTDLATLLTATEDSATVDVSSSGTLPSSNVTATALATGDDDRGDITSDEAIDALDVFVPGLGSGAVAIPGWTADQLGDELIAWAAETKRVALLATARTDDLAAAQVDAEAAADEEGNGGLFWPWLLTPSGATISPESAVAGLRARVIRNAGPWVAPAGGNGVLAYISDTDQKATRAEVDAAHDDSGVSVVTIVSGGPRLYGWRSLAGTNDLRYLHYRDTLNMIAYQVEEALEPYVYAPMTGALAQNAAGTCMGVLEPLVSGGALFPMVDDDGNTIDPGFQVTVSTTTGEAGEGILEPAIAVRIVAAAELILVPITKVAVGATLA